MITFNKFLKLQENDSFYYIYNNKQGETGRAFFKSEGFKSDRFETNSWDKEFDTAKMLKKWLDEEGWKYIGVEKYK